LNTAQEVEIARPYTMIARTVSDVFSPPVLAAPGLALACWASGVAGVHWFALVYFSMAVLPAACYVVWLVKSGRVADFHLPHRQDRRGVFLVSLASGLAALGTLVYMGAPSSFLAPILALLFQTLVLFLITLTWQISIHTATVSGLVTFAVLVLGGSAIVLFLLIPLVAWGRIYLGRHTPAQTIAGTCLGCSSFVLLFGVYALIWR